MHQANNYLDYIVRGFTFQALHLRIATISEATVGNGGKEADLS